MKLAFTKMQGAGNDFVVLDGVSQRFALTPEQLRRLADRHFGVGCDQILLVEPPRAAGTDFRYRIFNADGGEVEQCGNGARCFVRFVRERGLTDKNEIRVETAAGIIMPRMEADGEVTVNMGAPVFEPRRIPFVSGSDALVQPLLVGDITVEISAVSMGNPHAVHFCDQPVAQMPLDELGPKVEHLPIFPNRVNFELVRVLDRNNIEARVWERGVGETLACGTGACATAAAARILGKAERKIDIILGGGGLAVEQDVNGEMLLSGPAEIVFEGEWTGEV